MGGLLIRIPRRILLPLILLFCIVGAYSMNASSFDVIVMLVAGLVGFVFERYGIPLGPVVLGIILGGEVEHRFIQCISKSRSPLAFLSSPVSIILCLMCLGLLASALRRKRPSVDRHHEP
jgi:TctA family transporter